MQLPSNSSWQVLLKYLNFSVAGVDRDVWKVKTMEQHASLEGFRRGVLMAMQVPEHVKTIREQVREEEYAGLI